MELGEGIGGQIIENLDNGGSYNRGSTVYIFVTLKKSISQNLNKLNKTK